MAISLIHGIEQVPNDRPVIGLMRHAEREKIPKGELGNEIHITKKGVEDTLYLRHHFDQRLVKIYSSPVLRCVETAQHLSSIAKHPMIEVSRLLGDPGVFVEEPNIASQFFLQHAPMDIAAMLMSKAFSMPGFCPSVQLATKKLFIHLFELAKQDGIYLFITHDIILGIVNSILFPDKKLSEVWPDFLETLYLFKEDNLIYAVFREQNKFLFSDEWLYSNAEIPHKTEK